MPLEFALRPRFDLERPARRRRISGLRLHPLVLPIAAYWLAIAGVTHALIRSTAVDADITTEHAVMSGSPTIPIAAPLEAVAVASPAPAAPPQATAARPQDEPPVPRALDIVPARARTADRELLSRDEPPRVVHHDAPPPEPPAYPKPVEEPAQLREDIRKPVVSEEPSKREAPIASLPSCESAAAAASQTVDLRSARSAPDLTRDALAAVLENGAYLNHCAIPGRMALDICAAVQDGKAVGVSVMTAPPNAAISACVRRAVAALRFPRSSQLDVTRTRFAPGL